MNEKKFLYRAMSVHQREWIFGSPVEVYGGKVVIIPSTYFTRLHNDGTVHARSVVCDTGTLGQYIGRSDSFGSDIFDNDIITVNGRYPKLVRFIPSKCSFCFANIDNLCNERFWDIWQQPDEDWWRDMEIKVIGNIFDNSELLKHE